MTGAQVLLVLVTQRPSRVPGILGPFPVRWGPGTDTDELMETLCVILWGRICR